MGPVHIEISLLGTRQVVVQLLVLVRHLPSLSCLPPGRSNDLILEIKMMQKIFLVRSGSDCDSDMIDGD